MFGFITVIKGAVVPEHQHHHEQWTHLIEGEMELTINGETQVLLPGIAAHIPSMSLILQKQYRMQTHRLLLPGKR
jgi:glyoxylate utilization-related uncharacterized protein